MGIPGVVLARREDGAGIGTEKRNERHPRFGGDARCSDQNQYRPHTNTTAKIAQSSKAIRSASDSGSSGSGSGMFGSLLGD
jgi:hypothetical protein